MLRNLYELAQLFQELLLEVVFLLVLLLLRLLGESVKKGRLAVERRLLEERLLSAERKSARCVECVLQREEELNADGTFTAHLDIADTKEFLSQRRQDKK